MTTDAVVRSVTVTFKFGEKVEEVKLESAFFNNYITDENRPKLPTASPAPKRPAPPPAAPPLTRPVGPAYEEDSEPQAKRSQRSIKDRLGVAGVKVSYNARDPRDIVDYSDVDHFSVDFD